TKPWGWEMLAWAALALGAGLVIVALAPDYEAALWLALLVPIVVAFRRSVPRGLLRFRATDILFGLVLGTGLRLVSGWLEGAAAGPLTWPRFDTTNATWWLGDIIAPVLVAPLVEELFFHGLMLVALYTVVRRASRFPLVAGIAAALITTGAFVLAHLATGSLGTSWAGPVSVALVGLAGAGLVLTTGRIWCAVLTHAVFNATYVALALVGTLLDSGAPTLT
uniref:CPBP family intramembrane glutamic endopeptidase n=1 Tax=uncultured Aeromicrobium sp. TaxID=337820 RepID=UPI0025D6E534